MKERRIDETLHAGHCIGNISAMLIETRSSPQNKLSLEYMKDPANNCPNLANSIQDVSQSTAFALPASLHFGRPPVCPSKTTSPTKKTFSWNLLEDSDQRLGFNWLWIKNPKCNPGKWQHDQHLWSPSGFPPARACPKSSHWRRAPLPCPRGCPSRRSPSAAPA